MDAREFKVEDILKREARFMVPLYQRQYQWHDHRSYGGRTEAFWKDVSAKAVEVLEGAARFDHYMGALLLAPDNTHREFGMLPVVLVVDGQQRLTTFMLLLAALREVAREHECAGLVETTAEYLFNRPGSADSDPNARYKLMPTPADRAVFLDVLDKQLAEVRQAQGSAYWGGRVPQNTQRRALRAFEFFRSQIATFVATGLGDEEDIDFDTESQEDTGMAPGADVERRLGALLEALVFRLKLIVITLGEDDDAQVIFETLNSRGEPLLAMDLVRNNIFHRAQAEVRVAGGGRQRVEELYRDFWTPFDAGWWRERAPNARPVRPRIDHFLAHVLTAETGDRITVRELYAEYRSWACPDGRSRFAKVDDELAVLQRYTRTYETLEARPRVREADETIAWLGRRLGVWQNTTAYPVAFLIGDDTVRPETRFEIAKLVDSYLTRRALCELTPKNLNRIFPRMVEAFRRHGVSMEQAEEFLRSLEGPAATFPSDRELHESILVKPVYSSIASRRLTEVLWELELASRSGWAEPMAKPKWLSVEHVLPVAWQKYWELPNGAAASELDPEHPLRRERDSIIHTLGNLTLVTGPLNTSLGNRGFEEKKEKLAEHSGLVLNKEIVEHDHWDEVAIRERGERLAALAKKVWPALGTASSTVRRTAGT